MAESGLKKKKELDNSNLNVDESKINLLNSSVKNKDD